MPRRQRTPFNTRPRLAESVGACQGPARTCQPGQEACGPSGGGFLHGLPCVTQQRAAPLQDVQPEKGPVDLRLGADLSLDSRLARVA